LNLIDTIDSSALNIELQEEQDLKIPNLNQPLLGKTISFFK